MSAILGYLKTDCFVIATDTFSHYKENNNLIPLSYCLKTILLPHHKSCFSVTGHSLIVSQLFSFIQNKVIAKDVSSLLNVIINHFKCNISDAIIVEGMIGIIYLFGLNDKSEQLECHKIKVSVDGTLKYEREFEDVIIARPELNDHDKFLSEIGTRIVDEFLVEIMKQQKLEDEGKELSSRVGIGGQIHITTIHYDRIQKQITFISKIAHTFNDYDVIGNKMLTNT